MTIDPRARYLSFGEFRLDCRDEPVRSREASHAAIVHERGGRGLLVLFGIEPRFRGQWTNTARLLYNALLLPAGS